ncbi:hypothetical protein [Helicobacter phage phiHP33]|uniref:hypothetical protein n=1 Tax=Helicobacter phage phiHP33 TaxID=1069378 RepID=UPI00023907A3|nr:hypothetical protein phiHP33_gp01 [Helicobacter phage phiHP33]AET85155.1 hypothetical protein [Helicobacter phage phiHP33]
MRQEHETAKSFDELKAITQAFMLKKGAQANTTHQESEPTQEANNANAKAHTPERTQEKGAKPKSSAQTKKGALKPTKKAFSERQITAFRDSSQDSANSSFKTKAGHNANAFKTEQANNSNLRAKPSGEALKPGLTTHQSNQKGGSDE